jgi:hypothetical protein
MQQEPLVYREEVTSTLFAIADINVDVERILDLLEGEIDGEERFQEEDSCRRIQPPD